MHPKPESGADRNRRLPKLENKVALITGGDSGSAVRWRSHLHRKAPYVRLCTSTNTRTRTTHAAQRQATHFAESLAKGEPNRKKIALTIVEDKVREMV